jgi:hypothetical protein
MTKFRPNEKNVFNCSLVIHVDATSAIVKYYIYITVRPAHTRTHTPQVQNYAAKHRPSTRQNISESLRVISVKHSSVLPDDGSHKIRNMSE